MQLTNALLNTMIYVSASIGLMAAFLFVYTFVTPQREIKLIRGGDIAAAYSLGGAIIGFTLPLGVVISYHHGVLDLIIWAAVALITQIIIFWIVALLIGDVGKHIERDNTAAGAFLGACAIAGGVINAVCLIP
jgi:putative membrane protein